LEHQVTPVLLFLWKGSDLILLRFIPQNTRFHDSMDSEAVSVEAVGVLVVSVVEVFVQRFNSSKKSLKSAK